MLATALIGGAQAALLLAILGAGPDTDAFLAAYALYLPAALLANTLRSQLIPDFGPTDPETTYRRRAIAACSRAVVLGAIVCATLAAFAPLLAPLVTTGLPPSAQRISRNVLLVLCVVGFLHFYAAAISALLAGSRRFVASSVMYVVGGAIGLACSGVGLAVSGPVGGAAGILAGTTALALAHHLYARSFGVRLRPRLRWLRDRALFAMGLSVAGYAALTLSQQVNMAIALSAVSDVGAAITLYTLAMVIVLTPLNLTSLSLSLVLMPDLLEQLRNRGIAAAHDYVVRIAAFSAALLAPVVASYYCVGLPVMKLLLSPVLDSGHIQRLFELGEVFFALVVPLFLSQLGVAVAVALRRWRLILATALASVGFQVACVTALASRGSLGVAAAHVAASCLTAGLLTIGVFGRETVALVRRTASAVLPAVLLVAIVPFGRLLAGEDAQVAVLVCAVSVVAYGLGVLWLWPSVGRPLVRTLPFVARARHAELRD